MTQLLGAGWLERVLRVLAGAVGVAMLMMAVGFFVMPELLASTQLAAEPARAVGINSLRGDFGGLFLGMGLFCTLGATTQHRWLLLVPLVFLSGIVAGRLLSLAVDDVPLVVGRALASEIVFIAVLGLSLASFRVRAGREQGPGPLAALLDLRALAAVGLVAVMVVVGLRFQRSMGLALLEVSSAALLNNDRFDRLPDGLHVGLAGTGAPLPDNRRRGGSSFVKAGDHLFIVDIGPGSTLTHESMGVPLAEAEAVLLTHIHSDHMGGLGELLLKAWTRGPRTEPMRVVGPEGVEPLVQGFNLAYAVDAGFRIAHHGDLVAPESGYGGTPETLGPFGEDEAVVVFQDDTLTVTAFLVDHRPAEPAVGYRFDYKGRSAVISGDTLPSENLRRHARGADLLIHEVLQPEVLGVLNRTAVREGRASAAKLTADIVDYHTFPEEVARIARDEDVGHVVFHHFLPALPLRMLHPAFVGDAREIYAGPITVGAEGMVFSLAPGGDDVELGWLL